MSVRPSPIAGRWYPGDPDMLTRDLQEYLEQADVQIPQGKIWGVIAPHAGYYYSGTIAAHAFKCLSDLRPDLVVVVSPYHHGHSAYLLTTPHDQYETPLGVVPVDLGALARLDQALQPEGGLTRVTHDREHSLEIELPFLQHVLHEFTLLPIMMNQQSVPVAQALGRALAEELKDRQVLFVASSDLSHFYPQEMACQLDGELLRRLAAFDPLGVIEAEKQGVGFACGRGVIAAVLWATRKLGANKVTILKHGTSGHVNDDYRSVVGYGAAVIWEDAAD
ncbi:MAG: AmmeMemoRadiSam system protein B [Ardenticatenaceae bacterium]|nr:AmmeMemoRadiSam system protein B [Ardenticatenaceae bacterium]